MRVTVQLFAAARELAGGRELVVDAATVGEARRRLVEACPQLAPLAARSLMALNAEYADDAAVVSTGDKLALIPPVSGG
jgi:molybdopterin converting factor small subunit